MPSLVVQTEVTEIRRSDSSGYRALLHIRETRRGSTAREGGTGETWLARLKRADLKPDSFPYIRVCSDHFVNAMPSNLYDVNNPDWAPSLNLGPDIHAAGRCRERYERMTAGRAR